jgi:ligand-binding sensor domain-containing protein
VNKPLLVSVILGLLPAARASALPDVWAQSGPPGGHVTALATSPDTPGLSYAALEGGGLWRSTDGGKSYTPTAAPAPGVTITALAFDRSDPTRLYVGASNVLYVTNDDGVSFQDVAAVFDAITVILPDPSLDDRLYVATENGGVSKSDDHGATFADLESLMPFDPVVHAIAVDPSDSSRVYFGTSFTFFWSDDAGETVNASDTGPSDAADIIVDPSDPSRIYAVSGSSFAGGMFVSTDSGLSWAASGLSDVWSTSLVMDPAEPTRLFAGTYGSGLWRSEDGAASWLKASTGLSESRVAELEIAPDGELVLGGVYGGVFVSDDAASAWQRGGDGLTGAWVETIATSPSRIVVSSKGNAVFASADGGASWSFAGNGLPSADVLSLAVDPTNEDVVYAGTDGAGVYKSSDGLGLWSIAAAGLEGEAVTALAVDPTDSSFVLAGLRSPSGSTSVFESHDGGASFSAIGADVPGWVTAIVWSGGDVYVATEGEGLWKSSDKGQSFAAKNNGAGDYGVFLLSFAAHPVSGVLYEGQHGGGLGVSLDGAEQWSVFEEGLPAWWLSGLAPHPTHAGELFVATYFDGVVRTPDDGLSFQSFSAGLDNRNISALALTPDAATLVAGTRGGGAYIVAPTPLSSGEGGSGGSGGNGGSGEGGRAEGGAPVAVAGGNGAGGEPLAGASGDRDDPADEGCSCKLERSGSENASALAGALLLAIIAGRSRRSR